MNTLSPEDLIQNITNFKNFVEINRKLANVSVMNTSVLWATMRTSIGKFKAYFLLKKNVLGNSKLLTVNSNLRLKI